MHDLIRGMATLGHHSVDESLRNTFAEASSTTRVIAELFANRFDKQLVAGVAPEPGSALAAHVSRLHRKASDASSPKRCTTVSARPTRAVRDVDDPSQPDRRRGRGGFDRPSRAAPAWSAPGGRARCRTATPAAVDGGGPMYWSRGGDLGAELRAVLAQLYTPIAPLLV